MTVGTLLLRQVSPSWIQAGRVTSQVFKPTPKDGKQLSVYDGDKITPVDSWKHYTNSMGHESAGVLAVTVGECKTHDLPAKSDPEPFPEHAVILFDRCTSKSQIESKSKQLRNTAMQRGWMHQAEDNQ